LVLEAVIKDLIRAMVNLNLPTEDKGSTSIKIMEFQDPEEFQGLEDSQLYLHRKLWL